MHVKSRLLKKATEMENEIIKPGVSTGYRDLDYHTHGLNPGELIVIGGRPTMGKTSFAVNIAEHAAMQALDKAVLFFSMEMPKDSISLRLTASLGRIDLSKIRRGKLEEDEWARFGSSVSMLSECKLSIIDDARQSTDTIESVIAKQIEECPVSLIVIDYLQLITGDSKFETRNEELSKILRSLKCIAREYEVPVVVLSQLNRELEKRPNKRPVMSDLRDSGVIEEIADLILFVYRDEVYYQDSPDRGIAEIIIAKQRNGTTGTLQLRFEGRYCRFDNPAPDYYQG